MPNSTDSRPGLRVGSWPGPGFEDNAFINIFCGALLDAGLDVTPVADPRSSKFDQIDILQIHWPEEIFWRNLPAKSVVATALSTAWSIVKLRKRRVRIVWLVHNLRPHDPNALQQCIWPLYAWTLSRLIHGFISLSPATLPVIGRRLSLPSGLPSLAVRHPAYQVAAPLEARSEARIRWNVLSSALVLAFVGSIRGYKGVEQLADAAGKLGRPHCTTIIAGRSVDTELSRRLSIISDTFNNIDYRPRRLSDEEFVGIVRASDFVVLPFIDTLHSGSIVHALSLGRPVVTPRTPYSEDLADVVGADWVRLYAGDLTPALLGSLGAPPAGEPDLGQLSPRLLGARVSAFYRSLMVDKVASL